MPCLHLGVVSAYPPREDGLATLAYGSQMTWRRLDARYAELFERGAEGKALACLPA
jgi:hypothetical protein